MKVSTFYAFYSVLFCACALSSPTMTSAIIICAFTLFLLVLTVLARVWEVRKGEPS